VKEQAVVNHAAEVAEEALESSKVRLSGIMHVKTDLLCEVLKGTSKTPIGSGI
jgi:hypothetical protein